ncbi:hypothetical protein Hanom_Chr05g00404501 [Helianthus anomalus]
MLFIPLSHHTLICFGLISVDPTINHICFGLISVDPTINLEDPTIFIALTDFA